jgi:hypothetical protein
MIKRCYDPSNAAYSNYGGRSIAVCDRWLGDTGFDSFYQDMGTLPSSDYSLDRIDNSKSYSSDNCRWATKSQQARNRRSSKLITLGSTTKTLIDWCEEHKIKYSVVKDRLRYGWDIERALSTPLNVVKVKLEQKFGSWVIIKLLGSKSKCRCECGKTSDIRNYDLVNNKSVRCKSCSKLGNKYARTKNEIQNPSECT